MGVLEPQVHLSKPVGVESVRQYFLHTVQCHICQNRRYNATLWGSVLCREQFPLENKSHFEELLQNRFIHRNVLYQPFMTDVIKTAFNVAL